MYHKKKPTLKKFREVCQIHKGVISNIAAAFGVSRRALYNWCGDDPEFQEVIDEFKGKLLDECIRSARALAVGIPDIDPVTNKIVGWKERPDGYMLRYLMGTLGRREGYGENIDVTTNGKDIKADKVVIEVIDNRDKVLREEVSEDNDSDE